MILLVDDSDSRQHLATLLSERCSVRVETEIDSALAAIQRQLPELVVCSETVPRQVVASLIKRLRTDPATSSLTVMLLADLATRNEDSVAQADRNVIKLVRDDQFFVHVERQLELARLREESRASATRLALANGVVSLGTWEFDLTTKEFHCDAHMVEQIGISDQQTTRSPFSWRSVVSPLDGERVDAEFRNACATNSRFQTEFRVKRTDDSLIWLNCCGQILESPGRRSMVGIVKDVTERKQVAERLARNEARLSDLVRNANSAIIRWACDGTITHINEFAQAFFGYREDEVLGRHVSMLVPEQESTGRDLSNLVQDIVNFPERYTKNVNENIRRDGSRVWMSWTNRAVRNEQGQVLEIIAIGNDITERKLAALALQEREVQLEATVNSLTQGILVSDLSGYLLHWNRAALEMHGISELLDVEGQREKFQSAFELTSLDGYVLPFEQSPLPRILRGEEFQDVKLRIRHLQEGWTRIFSYRGTIIRRDDGQPFMALVVISDVTDQELTAEALRRTEQRLAIAASGARIAMFDWNIVTGEVLWEEEVVRLLGLAPPKKSPTTTTTPTRLSLSFQADDWAKRVHPEDLPRVMEETRRCYDEHKPFESEYRVIWLDGSIHWLAARAIFEYDAEGTPLHMVGILMDVTKDKQAEEALRSSERLLAADVEAMTRLQKLSTLFLSEGNLAQALQEIVESAISISSADFGNIQLLDEKTSRLRIVAQHGLPQWWVEFWDQEWESLGACGTALQLGKRVIVEDVEQSDIFRGKTALDVQRKAGIRAVQSTPLLNRAGELIGMFSTHYRSPGRPDERVLPLLDLLARQSADIIEHARAEASLREAKAAAETANQAKSQFLAHMSHELRTPMNAILGMVDIALPRVVNPMVKDCLRTIKESGDLLLTILNDLLDSAKIESGRIELVAEPFSLRKLLEHVLKVFLPRASEKGLKFSYRLSDATPDVWIGDQIRLQQVLLNLAGNAVKFTERGQVEIDVRTSSYDGNVALEFEVSDTGIGIGPSLIRHVFEPFVQADASASRRYGGTGLGLPISKGLVEAMGGHIWVESEEGHGSKFRFLVPLPLGAELPAEPPLHVLSTTPVATLRILLVEDNPANQKLATFILQDRGHHVEVAGDGLAALRMTEKTRYDVILMDVQMPGMDGMTATAAIRKREAGGDRVPIIAMTAHATQGYRDRCVAAGMDDYLSKPFDAHEMIRLIENLASARPRRSRLDDSESAKTIYTTQSSSPSPTPSIVFDPEVALKRCLNKPKMVQEMIQCFFREMDLLFPLMRTELRQGRLEEVGRLGHRLKGTVVFLGAFPASEAARQVEQFCEPNSGTISEAEEAVAVLEQKCIELKTVLLQHPFSS